MTDTDADIPAVETADTEEAANVIRPATAGSDALEDNGARAEDTEAAQPEVDGDGDAQAANDEAAGGSAAGAEAEVDADGAAEPEAEPDSEAAKPEAPAEAETAAEPEAETGGEQEPDASAEPPASGQDGSEPADKPAEGEEVQAEGGPAAYDKQPSGASRTGAEAEGGTAADGEAPVDLVATVEGAAPAVEGEEGERPGSSHSQHPDIITDINQSPEAHAEVDEMAQQQAREVIRSRQSSATGDRTKLSSAGAAPAAPPADDGKRRSSASNASVKSASGSQPKQAPNDAIAKFAMQPPSPSKIKSGPWLTGTYRLPKSGKIISGEELCEALERMTNAYIDKYTRDKDGLTKEIAPGAATVYNTKTLTPDEYDTMISRLYKPKDRNVQDSDRIQLVTLKFSEDGQEQWQPVKQVSSEEQQQYMCALYQRCLDQRKKTQEDLAAKYLKPLGMPRKK